MFERYADVFRHLNCSVTLDKETGITHLQPNKSLLPIKLQSKEKR